MRNRIGFNRSDITKASGWNALRRTDQVREMFGLKEEPYGS